MLVKKYLIVKGNLSARFMVMLLQKISDQK